MKKTIQCKLCKVELIANGRTALVQAYLDHLEVVHPDQAELYHKLQREHKQAVLTAKRKLYDEMNKMTDAPELFINPAR